MEEEGQIRKQLKDFVISNFLFGAGGQALGDDALLMEQGIIDSTGILELIDFLEHDFEIEVSESETLPTNLGSIDALVQYVTSKRRA